MEAWHIWVIVALVFVIVEIFTTGFAVMCISFGCLFGAAVSLFELDVKWQLLAFAVGTVLAFLTVRPLVYKFFYKKGQEVKTNAEALVGRRAIVTERVGDEMHPGRVKVDGDTPRPNAYTPPHNRHPREPAPNLRLCAPYLSDLPYNSAARGFRWFRMYSSPEQNALRF